MKVKRISQSDRRHVPVGRIRAVVKQIAEKFQPEKIILFGSYAYGAPKPERRGFARGDGDAVARTSYESFGDMFVLASYRD